MRYPILIFLIILYSIGNAQQNFVKGYYLTNSGDSIGGYLNKETDSRLATTLQFKPAPNSTEIQSLKPGDISGFGFENGNIYKSVSYIDPLDSNKRKNEFAKFLVEGRNNLYALARQESYYYYLTTPGDSTYFLYNDKIDTRGNARNGNFRNILYFLAGDCQDLQRTAEHLPFAQSNLIVFIKGLNSCSGDVKSVVHLRKIRNTTHFLLYGGAMWYGKNSTYTFQGQMRIISPGVSERTSLVVGIAYSHLVEYDAFEYGYTQHAKDYFTTDFFSIPMFFQHNFTETKFQPLLYAGFSLAYRKLAFPELFDSPGYTEKFGAVLVGGIGVEYYPIKHLALKADWRYEYRWHYPTIGIAYKIK